MSQFQNNSEKINELPISNEIPNELPAELSTAEQVEKFWKQAPIIILPLIVSSLWSFSQSPETKAPESNKPIPQTEKATTHSTAHSKQELHSSLKNIRPKI